MTKPCSVAVYRRPLLCGSAAALLLLAGCRQYSLPIYPDDYREFAYVANTGDGSVSVLDLVQLKRETTLKVAADPVAEASNPKRNEVYVVSRQSGQTAGSVAVIDTVKGAVVATIPVGRSPEAIAVAPDGNRAYVVNRGSDSVSEIDLDRRRLVTSLPAGHQPNGIAAAADGRTVAVTSGVDGSLLLYSIAPASKSPMSLRAVMRGCPGASSPAILPNLPHPSKVFAACTASNQVMAVGLAMPPDSWEARQDSSLVRDRLLTLLDVGKQPMYLTVKPDGGEIFVSNAGSDSVSEIATTQNEVGSTYPIGNRPGHGLVSQDGSRLWVSSCAGDAISLYSIDDGKFVSSLPAGGAPDMLAYSADEHLLLAADARTGDVAVIRTESKLGPVLLTILPAGPDPTAIAVKAMPGQH